VALAVQAVLVGRVALVDLVAPVGPEESVVREELAGRED